VPPLIAEVAARFQQQQRQHEGELRADVHVVINIWSGPLQDPTVGNQQSMINSSRRQSQRAGYSGRFDAIAVLTSGGRESGLLGCLERPPQ